MDLCLMYGCTMIKDIVATTLITRIALGVILDLDHPIRQALEVQTPCKELKWNTLDTGMVLVRYQSLSVPEQTAF